LGGRHWHTLFVEEALHDTAYFGADAVFGNRRSSLQVEHTDELTVNLGLQLEIAVSTAGSDGQRAAACRQGSVGSQVFSLVAPDWGSRLDYIAWKRPTSRPRRRLADRTSTLDAGKP